MRNPPLTDFTIRHLERYPDILTRTNPGRHSLWLTFPSKREPVQLIASDDEAEIDNYLAEFVASVEHRYPDIERRIERRDSLGPRDEPPPTITRDNLTMVVGMMLAALGIDPPHGDGFDVMDDIITGIAGILGKNGVAHVVPSYHRTAKEEE